MTTLYFHGSDHDFSHSVSGTREQMDCKEETTNVIILTLVRETFCKWQLMSLTAGCAVREEEIGCVF